jgi:cytosine deaminase
MIELLIRNATLLDGTRGIDIAVDSGVIIGKGMQLDYQARQEFQLGGKLIIPGFVDPHVHLDIILMNSFEKPGRTEPYLSHYGLNDTVERRREGFTSGDIEERAGAALELASRHGITALRAQCHVDTKVGLKHIEALQRVKEQYAGRVTVQIVTFPQQGFSSNPGTLDLIREAFQSGADVVGCASNLDFDSAGKVDFKKHIDTAFDMALELGVDLDIHADLGIPRDVELDDLEIVHVARRTIELGYQGRVAAGHVCALGSASQDVAQKAIELIKEADISVISQPDLYRLGRDDTQNVRRGLTRVKELLAAGVNVTYASNNVRDALRPMGNLNPLEEALILSYGAHMDTIEEFDTLMKMSTYNAAKALQLPNYGLEEGCDADFIILDAYTPSGAIVGQVEKNYVFKAGRLMASSRVVSEIFNGTYFQEVKKTEVN